MRPVKSIQLRVLTGSQPAQRARAVSLLVVGLTLVCSGCSLMQGVNNHIAYNDSTNDFVMGWRNSVWASQTWHSQKGHFVDHPEFRAFGAGFRDGYRDVASGGNGCPPPVPPRKYWSWKYQTPEGQCKVAAWFEGFGHGARAAEEDGAGNFQDIQVSYAIEAQYSPEFQNGQIPSLNPGEYIIPGESFEPPSLELIPEGTSSSSRAIPREGTGVAPASWATPTHKIQGWPVARTPPADAIGQPGQSPPLSLAIPR